MKTLFLLLFLTAGCSKGINSQLPGAELPKKGIDKTRPRVESTRPMLNLDLEKALSETLENQFVNAYDLKLYQNGESFGPLLKLIENSSEFLFLNFLSFTCDEKTEPLVKALEEKVKAKTDVRLIVNKGFSFLSRACLRRLEQTGVKIKRAKSHASYVVNDRRELMIGSQSIARMFFNADGFNGLDRDMMAGVKGSVSAQAVRDFTSSWLFENPNDSDLVKTFLKTLQWKNESTQADAKCLFLSQRPREGMRDYEKAIVENVKRAEKEIIFSGVKVNARDSETAHLLRLKSSNGVQVNYIGNGYLSGNGELAMLFDEWINELNHSFSFIAPVLENIKLWDNRRVALENKKLYDALIAESSINVWAYFNFIHHKVWLFDGPYFIIGSANFDEEKFSEVSDAGLFCADQKVHDLLKEELLRDQQNSLRYEPMKRAGMNQ